MKKYTLDEMKNFASGMFTPFDVDKCYFVKVDQATGKNLYAMKFADVLEAVEELEPKVKGKEKEPKVKGKK